MTDTRKHFAQQTSCVFSCILFIHKSSSLFNTEQSGDRPKFDTSVLGGGGGDKKTKTYPPKKMHLGQVLQSATSFETDFFFFLLA